MDLRTPFGLKENATRGELEETLDALQRASDEDVFVTVERDDGTFLQMRRLPIEHGGPQMARPRRASVPPGVRDMFVEFAAGNREWDRGVEWIEAPPPRWWQALPWWAVVLPWVLFAALLFWTVARVR